MNFFDSRHFRINKMFLSIIGQWPSQTIRRKYVSLVVLFLLAGTQIIAKLCATLSSCNDINVVMEDMASLMADAAGSIKLLNGALKTKEMRELLARVQLDYASFETDDELKIMQEFAEDGRKMTIMYSGVFFVLMMFFMIPPLKPIFFNNLNGTDERVFIHHTEYFVDPLDYFYPIMLHSYITIFIVVCSIVAMDTMFVIFVQHACGLFTTLGYRLCRITENDTLLIDINPSRRNDKSFKNISLCVRRHQEAIEFANLMESYYSTSFFLHAGLNVMGLSITGAQVITTTQTNNFFQHCSVFYAALAHLLFECVNGQRLIDHSDRIHDYLINVKWYQTSLRTRKVVNLMTVKSRLPCILSAGGMFDISMETFSAILRTSMSYFTVLRSTQ